MAYQSLNIIGSFNAGTAAVQREIAGDRDRAEAYRTAVRQQIDLRNRGTVEDVNDVDSQDRMVLGDAPHDRRNPYLFLRYQTRPEGEASGPPAPGAEPGASLDVLI